MNKEIAFLRQSPTTLFPDRLSVCPKPRKFSVSDALPFSCEGSALARWTHHPYMTSLYLEDWQLCYPLCSLARQKLVAKCLIKPYLFLPSVWRRSPDGLVNFVFSSADFPASYKWNSLCWPSCPIPNALLNFSYNMYSGERVRRGKGGGRRTRKGRGKKEEEEGGKIKDREGRDEETTSREDEGRGRRERRDNILVGTFRMSLNFPLLI